MIVYNLEVFFLNLEVLGIGGYFGYLDMSFDPAEFATTQGLANSSSVEDWLLGGGPNNGENTTASLYALSEVLTWPADDPPPPEPVPPTPKNLQIKWNSVKNSKYIRFPYESAFNGFGLYRRAKFEGSTYEWNIHKNIEIIPRNWIQENEDIVGRTAELRKTPDDCEHRYFHMRASQLNGARICISPLCLFTS